MTCIAVSIQMARMNADTQGIVDGRAQEGRVVLSFSQFEHEGDAVFLRAFQQRGADQNRGAAAILADVFLLIGLESPPCRSISSSHASAVRYSGASCRRIRHGLRVDLANSLRSEETHRLHQ
jgi:hypothetical protein